MMIIIYICVSYVSCYVCVVCMHVNRKAERERERGNMWFEFKKYLGVINEVSVRFQFTFLLHVK